MAKKSFILYNDQKEVIDELSDEDAGKLLKAIYQYNTSKEMKLTGMLKIIFIQFKNSFDRDSQKWDEISTKRSEAGKKHSGNQYTKNGTNGTSVPTMEQNGTNGTVSVSDSVNDSVSDSVSVSDNKYIGDSDNIETKPKKGFPHTHTEIFDYCYFLFPDSVDADLEESCKKCFLHYQSTNWKGIEDWKSKVELWIMDDIKKGKIRKIDTSRRLD